MNPKEASVISHYQLGGLLNKITAGLELAGKNIHALQIDDLAPVDAFHTRGRDSTIELAELAQLSATDQVLDVGCGLGGSARYLADRFGCKVIGIDLTQEYIEVAETLTGMLEFEVPPVFRQGSASELPFDDGAFEVVWTEHAQMNIPDKAGFYSEIFRVLKPGGKLVFHDIFAGDSGAGQGAPTYPLPWAEVESLSALASESEVQQQMASTGFRIMEWKNKVNESLVFFQNVIERIKEKGTPPLGIHLLMGETARQKISNYVESMSSGRLSTALGVCRKPDATNN